MNDLLPKLEEIARGMPPGPLLLTGIIAVSLGLFLWLGGLRFCWMVVGLLGGAAGACVGLWVADWFELQVPVSMIIGATVLALGAILIQHAIIVALATIIFATICGSGYVGYLMETARPLLPESSSSQQNLSDEGDSSAQTIQDKIAQGQKIYDGVRRVREKVSEGTAGPTEPDASVQNDPDLPEQLTDNTPSASPRSQGAMAGIRQIYEQLSPYLTGHHGQLFLWCLAGGVVGLILAHLLKTVIMALCCSIVGCAGTIGGVIILLMGKGTAVAASLAEKPKFLPALFLTMVLFGWIVQLFLSSSSSRKKASRQSESQEE
jgi:hypothetical protein